MEKLNNQQFIGISAIIFAASFGATLGLGSCSSMAFLMSIPVILAWKAQRKSLLLPLSIAAVAGFTAVYLLLGMPTVSSGLANQTVSMLVFATLLVVLTYPANATSEPNNSHHGKTKGQARMEGDWEIGQFLDDDLKEEVMALAETRPNPNMEFAKEGDGAMKRLMSLETKFHALDQVALIAISDISGNITYVNDNFAKRSQYSAKELIGHNHRLQKSGMHPDGYFDELRMTIAANKVWHGEICNKAKDGTFYWMDTIVAPIEPEITPDTKYMAFGIDITHLKEDHNSEPSSFLRAFSRKLAEKNTVLQAQIEQLEESNHQLDVMTQQFPIWIRPEDRYNQFHQSFEAAGLTVEVSQQDINEGIAANFFWSSETQQNQMYFAFAQYVDHCTEYSPIEQTALSDFLYSQINNSQPLLFTDVAKKINDVNSGIQILIGKVDKESFQICLVSNQPLIIKTVLGQEHLLIPFEPYQMLMNQGASLSTIWRNANPCDTMLEIGRS